MTLETELVTITKVKATKFKNRQDYLAAVTRYISDKLTVDQYDALPDHVIAWFEKAVDSMNKKYPIADYPDAKVEEVESEAEEPEASEEAAPTDDHEAEADAGDVADESGDGEPEPEAPKPVKRVGGKVKPIKPPEPKLTPDEAAARYTGLTGEKDKWGITKGTKASDAAAMFEKGCTMNQITEALGGKYYNMLKQMAKDGHLVEKKQVGWKLTHKSDL